MRSGSSHRRRLTLASNQFRMPSIVEFGSPNYPDHSVFSSISSTPSYTEPTTSGSPGAAPLPSCLGGSGRELGQRTSLRRKSLALACAVSVDLAMGDDDARMFIFINARFMQAINEKLMQNIAKHAKAQTTTASLDKISSDLNPFQMNN